MKRLSLWVLLILSLPVFCWPAEVLLDEDFEGADLGTLKAGWGSFTEGTSVNVNVIRLAESAGGGKCLEGRGTESAGLTALTWNFANRQQRVRIEFDLAVSESKGRAFHIWTFAPGGKDASQLNLATHRGWPRQYSEGSWIDAGPKLKPSPSMEKPVWYRVRALVDAKSDSVEIWISPPGTRSISDETTSIARMAYKSTTPILGIGLVSGSRIAKDAWYLVDNLFIEGGQDLPAPKEAEPLTDPFSLWSGPEIPEDPEEIPFVPGMETRAIHEATEDGYKFLHGAAIIEHEGVFYANWANSPRDENGPHETLQGRRSRDGGKTWSELEVIGPGFEGPERHSHGVLFEHRGELWTICARFGVGTKGKVFPGLKGEAFVLDEKEDTWKSRGIVMDNCWPYDEPVRMGDGNYITGGQDRNGLPVVAISHGEDFTKWDTVLLPYHPMLRPSFAETTVWAEGSRVIAVIRGGGGIAWVSESKDHGKTWSIAGPSNFPMTRAKAYLGKLSTGQLYLISNLKNRDTLVVSTGKPGELSLSSMWRIRHGKSEAPRFEGFAKGPQWSYPYAHEHDGKLYVVYSIGKENCGLSVLPVEALRAE